MANGHGGARIGAGQKKKALSEESSRAIRAKEN